MHYIPTQTRLETLKLATECRLEFRPIVCLKRMIGFTGMGYYHLVMDQCASLSLAESGGLSRDIAIYRRI